MDNITQAGLTQNVEGRQIRLSNLPLKEIVSGFLFLLVLYGFFNFASGVKKEVAEIRSVIVDRQFVSAKGSDGKDQIVPISFAGLVKVEKELSPEEKDQMCK